MNLTFDDRTEKILESLSELERGRVSGYIDLFAENGFSMSGKYLKKLDSNLWELRPGNIRVLFGKVETSIIIVNIFKKKTQKTPKKEINLAKNRLKEY